MADKPSATRTMLLDIVHGKNIYRYCIKLSDFTLIFKNDEVVLDVYYKMSEIFKKLKIKNTNIFDIILCVSDDPYMQMAADWMNMGYSMLRIEMKECSLDVNHFIICQENNFQMKIALPQRGVSKWQQ